jgi:DHA1 family multidrug resistance protein-like MFS transporter
MKNSFTLITIYLVAFTGFAGFSWLSVVTPYYLNSLGINVSEIGLLISTYAFVNAIGMLPSSILSERWGRRRFLMIGLVIAAVAPLLYPFAREIWVLYLICVLHGLGSTLFMPTALAVVTELSEPEEFGRSIGWYSASAQLGLMAGPAAGGFILQHFGFVAAYSTCGLMPLMALILVSARMRHIPPKFATHFTTNLRSWGWIKNRGAMLSLLTLIVIAAGSSALNTFIPLYVRDFGITEAGAGMIITACYASSAALRIPSGTLADKFGNAPIVTLGVVISSVAIALIAAFSQLYQIALAALLFGIGIGLAMPAALSWLAYISPPDKRGLAMGLGSAAFQVGLALGATTLGVIAQNKGYGFMYLSMAAVIGASGIVTIICLRPWKYRVP